MNVRLTTVFAVSLIAFGLAAYAAVSWSNPSRSPDVAAGNPAWSTAADAVLVVAGDDSGKTCTHEGREDGPGRILCIEGSTHECDGRTGEWVKQGEACL